MWLVKISTPMPSCPSNLLIIGLFIRPSTENNSINWTLANGDWARLLTQSNGNSIIFIFCFQLLDFRRKTWRRIWWNAGWSQALTTGKSLYLGKTKGEGGMKWAYCPLVNPVDVFAGVIKNQWKFGKRRRMEECVGRRAALHWTPSTITKRERAMGG